jgi:TRAP-type C4-dicarboxylate transport system permease small subunit
VRIAPAAFKKRARRSQMPSHLIRKSEKTIEWLVVALFVALVVLGVMQVFFRYVVGSSLVWSEELCKIMFFYIIFMGASIAIKNNSFASVDYLYQFFPVTMKKYVDIIIWLMVIGFLILVIVLGTKITFKTMSQITPALEIPQAVVYAAVPFGSLIMCLSAINFFYRLVTNKGE